MSRGDGGTRDDEPVALARQELGALARVDLPLRARQDRRPPDDLPLRVRLAVAHAALEAHAQFLPGFAVPRVVRADLGPRRVADQEDLLDASERLAAEELLEILDVVVQAPEAELRIARS